MHEDWVCGRLVGLATGRISLREKWSWGRTERAELNRRLHPLICVLAGTGNRINMTLHRLAHVRVKSGVILGEVSL